MLTISRFRSAFAGAVFVSTGALSQGGPPPAAVETAPAEQRTLSPRITVTGQVRSRSAADLSAAVAGTLAWVAEPGARMNAGALVARLDTDELSLQKLEQEARVKRGEINLQQLGREADRLEALGSAVSRFQLEQAQSQRDLAAADLEIARATLKQLQERLSRAEVRAPFAGVVSDRVHRAGEEVNRGEAVARLVDPNSLEVRLFLPLKHVGAIRTGDRVTLQSEGGPVSARVRSIVPAGDARSQSFEVLVDLPAEAGLAVGSTVPVALPLGTPRAQMAVPRDALILRADGTSVYRVKADTAERLAVIPGVADGDWVAVTGALEPGERVVVRGGENLQDGAPVKVVGVRDTWATSSGASASARSAR